MLVVAVLLCHGVFGYAHELSPPEATKVPSAHSTPGPQHAMAGQHDASHSEHGVGGHLSAGGYFAILLALLFGAFLLPRGGLPASVRLPAPAFFERRLVFRTLHPPRGPTAPFLQVFRL